MGESIGWKSPSAAAVARLPGIDGDVDVGLGVLALGSDAFAELGVVAGQELDLDPGLVLELWNASSTS